MHDHGLGRETNDFLQLWAEFHVSLYRLLSLVYIIFYLKVYKCT